MGGKNYPKKGSASKGSQDSAVSPTSGGQQQQQRPGETSIRQRLQQISVSTVSGSQQQQQQRGPQTQAQQQRQPQQQQQQGQKHGQQQSGMSRSESTQSVRSESSQGAWGGSQHSESSGGATKSQKSHTKPGIASEAAKNVNRLQVEYKGAGRSGRKLGQIETNYLQLVINKMAENAYHYDVAIEPDRPKKLLPMVFLRFAEINLPNVSIAFDGKKNAYAAAPIKIKEFQREIEIIHPETGAARKFIVSIQEAKDSRIPIKKALSTYQTTRQNEDSQRALQAVEVILKSAFNQKHLNNGIQGGRSFFLPPTKGRQYLGDCFELWLGLFQSLCLGKIPLINVDVNHKAFPKRYNDLTDMLRDMERDEQEKRARDRRNQGGPQFRIDLNRPLDRFILNAVENFLKGLEICYTNTKTGVQRIYKYMSLEKSPNQVTFSLGNQQTTVLKHFQNTGRKIQYPALPCIKIGNSLNNQIVPMEFCSIFNKQVVNKKCTEEQTRSIIRVAATNTDSRKQKIMDLINQIKHNESPTIQGFGLHVDPNFIKVDARQLEPPKIQYGNRIIEPMKGVWRGESMQFFLPSENVQKWGILNASRAQHSQLDNLVRMLNSISNSTGLQLAKEPLYKKTVGDRDLRLIERELQNVGTDKEIRILFCIIPDAGPTYAKIKQLAEINYGVLTQCIKYNTLNRKVNDGSTISNILLKVNAKLNGTNHRLLTSNKILSGKKVMVIGADVTHPSPDQKTQIPSVVGVAASHDEHAFCYNVCWRLQDPKKEIIEDFKTIMKEHLEFFRKKNHGVLPDKIFYYRDGVSEGQFDQVMATEKTAMLQACHEINPDYGKKVQLTIVVVQKRHHTRFFPGQTQVGKGDKNNNVPAGTIVDTMITRPNENHFYLVSHQSIQGVAKPTKYAILLDQGNHNIDDLQGLTYNLCHLFSRCNRSVSYPAPTYYAHLVAARGKVYIDNCGERKADLRMDDLPREFSKRVIKDNIIKGHPMYFV